MRYIPHTGDEIREMLKTCGLTNVKELFNSIPEELQLKKKLDLPAPLAEQELLKHLQELGRKNKQAGENLSFLGAGSYQHFVPSAVGEIISRSEWLTPYTPYQPEISQGTLQAIFEFQTMICNLTDMEVATASHYDGSTATAEAALMALSKTRKNEVVIASTLHPEYRATIDTVIRPRGQRTHVVPYGEDGRINMNALKETISGKAACVIIQSPNYFGVVEDLQSISDLVHQSQAMFVVATTDPTCWGVFKGPGSFGADIVTAEGQSFGGGLNFGGPYLGLFTSREKYLRSMPGRITGETTDTDGKRGFVLTMSTREQHIRREKATSNICTNQALMATTAAVYLSLMGRTGLKEISETNIANAEYLKSELSKISGVKIQFSAPVYNEFVIDTGVDTSALLKALSEKGIFGGVPLECYYPELKTHMLITTTEVHNKRDIDIFVRTLEDQLKKI